MIHNARYLDETKNTQKTNNAHTKCTQHIQNKDKTKKTLNLF